MSAVAEWLAARTRHAPPVLLARVEAHVAAVGGGEAPAARGPALAAAGERAMRDVLAHEGDRRVALDLLAADALITLALLAEAERDPAGLDAFADALLGGTADAGLRGA